MMIMTQQDHRRLSRAARKHRLQTRPGLSGSRDEARGAGVEGGTSAANPTNLFQNERMFDKEQDRKAVV